MNGRGSPPWQPVEALTATNVQVSEPDISPSTVEGARDQENKNDHASSVRATPPQVVASTTPSTRANARDTERLSDSRPFLRCFWAEFQADGTLASVHTKSTLALVDTGANVTAIVTRAELERLGMHEQVKALPIRDGTPMGSTLTPVGGGAIRVVGTIVLQPMVRAQRQTSHAHGNPHTVNVVLPGIAALVVDQPLAGCELIIGELTLQALGASLHRSGRRRKLVLQDGGGLLTSVALVDGSCVAGDGESVSRVTATMTTLAEFRLSDGVAALCDAAAAEQKRLVDECITRDPCGMTGLELTADDAPTERTDGGVRRDPQRHTGDSLPPSGAAVVSAIDREIDKTLREVRMRVANEARARDSEALRQRRLADELEAQFRASLATDAEQEEEAERERVREKMRPHLQALLDHMRGVSVSADTRTETPLFGDAVYQLSADETSKLIDHLNALASSACLDPAVVKRDPHAADMPFRAILQLKPEAVDMPPTREGFARSYTVDKMDAIRAQVTQMLRAGVIEPAGPHCRWAHAAVLVKKSDGTWRFCIDYRPLNRRLESEHYAIPTVDEVCRVLATDGGYYSRYDLKSAFWQVPLDENSRDLSAFYVPRMGLFRFNVLAFGLASATSLFQKNIEHIMAPLLFNGVIVYIDDLIVYGKTKSELLDRMTAVQALFRKYDLRIAPGKCEFVSATIDVLGKRVSAGRVSPNPEHVKPFAEWKRPSNVQELRSFLGAAGWYRQHIPGFATMAAPLYALETAVRQKRVADGTSATAISKAEDRTPLTWTADADRAFGAIRRALAQPPVLAVPSPHQLDGRLRIMADAHEGTADGKQSGGVGGVLEWLGDDGQWHLVLAHSRALTDAERNYTTTQVELLALVEVVKKAEQYIAKARRVQLCTDHQAIVFLESLRQHQGGRLGRWAAWLGAFDVELVYRPGRHNVTADALSRAHVTNEQPLVNAVHTRAAVPNTCVERTRAQLNVIRSNIASGNAAKFDLAVVDPPWQYLHHGARPDNRIDFRDLCELRVGEVMSDHAALLIWATGPKVEEAHRVARVWGFTPTTVAFVWNRGALGAVPGRYTTPCTEMAVLAVRQDARRRLLANPHDSSISQLIDVPMTTTGGGPGVERLPEEFWVAVERLFRTDATRLQVFGRARRAGWTTIYDSVGGNATSTTQSTAVAPVTVVAGDSPPQASKPNQRRDDDGHEQQQPPLVAPPSAPRDNTPSEPPRAKNNSSDPTPAPRGKKPDADIGEHGPLGADDDDALVAVAPPAPPDGLQSRSREEPENVVPRIVDVLHEQDWYEQRQAQDKQILAMQSETVLLELTTNDHTRALLAQLMLASGNPMSPALQSKMRRWTQLETHTTRQLHSALTRAHALTLDAIPVPWPQLRAALARKKEEGKERVCEDWLLRNETEGEFIHGATYDELKQRCDDAEALDAGAQQERQLRVMCIGLDTLDGETTGKLLMPLDATEVRDAVIRRVHASLGHPGAQKTLGAMRESGWYIQSVRRCVQAQVAECMRCSRRKGELKSWKPSEQAPPLASQAIGWNDRLHMDVLGPIQSPDGPRYVLTMTDACTRWPEAMILESKEADAIARCWVNVWVCRYGPPAKLTTDRGHEFACRVLDEAARVMGVERLLTTPYHPQANGIDERPHHTLVALLALLQEDGVVEGADWRHLLPLALFTMRTTVHRMTKQTPMKLVFGVEAALPEALYYAPSVRQHMRDGVIRMEPSRANVDADGVVRTEQQRKRRFEEAARLANYRTQEVQRLWQRLFDKAVVEESVRQAQISPEQSPLAGIAVGDYVRVFDADVLQRDEHTVSPKLEALRWSAPYRVFQKVRGAAVVLTLATDPLKHRVETGLRVKRIELPEELKRQYDALFEATQADRTRARQRRRQVLEECGWHYDEEAPEEEFVYVEEVLRVRGRQGAEEVLVRWSNEQVRWATMDNVRQLAPEALHRYRQAQQRLYGMPRA